LGARFISGGRWNPQKPKELSKLVHLSVGKTFGWIHEKARQSSDHSVEVETLETKIKAASEKIDADPNKIQVDGSKVDIASFFQGEVKEEKKEAA